MSREFWVVPHLMHVFQSEVAARKAAVITLDPNGKPLKTGEVIRVREVDPDDAPELTDAALQGGTWKVGGKVVDEETGKAAMREALRSSNPSDAKDAARYRWLREHSNLKVYSGLSGAGLDIAVDVDMGVAADVAGAARSHPWGDFLSVRAKAIDWLHDEGKDDTEIAETLSLDSAEHVYLIRTRDRS